MSKKTSREPAASRPSRNVRAAHRKLESSLILDVVGEALSASSGTKTYGFDK